MGVEVARIVESLSNRFQTDLAVGGQFESIQVDISVIWPMSVLAMDLVDDPWEDLFERIEARIQSCSDNATGAVGCSTVAVATHDGASRQIVGVIQTEQMPYLMHRSGKEAKRSGLGNRGIWNNFCTQWFL